MDNNTRHVGGLVKTVLSDIHVSEAREAWFRARRKSLHKLRFSYPALISEVLLLLLEKDDMNSNTEALLS